MSFKKLIKGALAIGFIVGLAGCSKAVSVPQTSYSVEVDGETGTVDYSKIYQNQNMTLHSTFCMYHCDKGYVWNMPVHKATFNGDYAMPKSNKLDLTVGSTLIIEFNRDGGKEQIAKRLQNIAENYRPVIQGGPKENQVFSWEIAPVFDYVLPISKYKSIVRQNLADKTITDAYDDLSSIGPVAEAIEKSVRKHLKDSGDNFKLVRLEFHKLSLPKEVNVKNKQEYNLDAQERIQKRQLAMQRARVKERHLLNLEELGNDVELMEMVKPTLSKAVLVYKWQQWANNSVENGVPVAIDPSMLNPAVSEMAGKAFDYDKFEETLNRRKSEVSNAIKKEQACAENADGCDK